METLCNVPAIVLNGADWYAGLGPEKNGGPKLFCVSGHVVRPGVFEATMHTTVRELIYDYAASQNLPVVRVTMWETPTSFAEYRRD